MEITVSILLQIITVTITALTLLTDYFYKLAVNKKTRTFNVIVHEMMQRLDDYRAAYSNILYYTAPEKIAKCKELNKTSNRFNNLFAYELNLARAQIRTSSWPFWEKEVHMHRKMDELCKYALQYYEHPKKGMIEKLNALRDEFFVECSIYDWAIWEYNQKQITGKDTARVGMDKQYYTVLTRIHNSGSGRTLKFKEGFGVVYDYYMNEVAKNEQKEAERRGDK